MADVIVLGAGIIGASVALSLALRGQNVALVDRRAPGEETSYGNAGLIQREGVMPHAFPQGLSKLLAYGRNDRIDMFYHARALPGLAPFLARYWWHSRPEQYLKVMRAYAPLIAACLDEHAPLIAAAGAEGLIGKDGWHRLFRTAAARDAAYAEAEFAQREFGVRHSQLSATEMLAKEPGLGTVLSGALHWTDPWSIAEPGALVAAYADRVKALGGAVLRGDARTLRQAGSGWFVVTEAGPIEAGQVVIALGPWAGEVTEPLGYRLPLQVKRGYHMHYAQPNDVPLTSWVHDSERGYMLAPMRRGIRLTTGAEFAGRDAAATPVQLGRAEPAARQIFPGLGERLEATPWLGARPCTPDMMPIIGPAPRHKGLLFAFGHAHHGMTLGGVTGRLIAELAMGERPFLDIAAFSAARFG